jgi:hypothetical protein
LHFGLKPGEMCVKQLTVRGLPAGQGIDVGRHKMINFPLSEEYTFTRIEADHEFSELLRPVLTRLVASNSEAPLIENLTPRTRDAARPASLSSIYGLGALPVHTDCAYYNLPPQYVILRNIGDRTNCKTILISRRSLREHLGYESQTKGIWSVKGKNRMFFGKIDNGKFVRWDANIMKPLNAEARAERRDMSNFLENSEVIRIEWTNYGDTLLFNNWYWLHAREKSEDTTDRILQRVLVAENVDL